MWPIYDAAVALFLTLWLVCSAIAQTSWSRFLVPNRFGVLPGYRFFGPTPVSMDWVVYARAIDAQGYARPWESLIAAPRRRWSLIWNPDWRHVTCVWALLAGLARHGDA